jgi:hypothetical protein
MRVLGHPTQGRGDRHFLTEATKLIPESPDRDRTYLDRILASLPEEDDYITRDGQQLKVTDSGQA